MKSLIVFLFSLLVTTCGTSGAKQGTVTQEDLLPVLIEKTEIYKSLVASKQDSSGFIESDHCDALLFTSLLRASTSSLAVDLYSARSSANKWFRRPMVTPDVDPCYPDHSKSSISRDMFTGVLWYAWRVKDVQMLEDLWDYGIENTWVMGDGDASRTVMTVNMQGLLARTIYRLGGTDHPIARAYPAVYTKAQTGFQAHLTVLAILLQGELDKEVSDSNLGILKHHAEREPRNSLFRYGYAKYSDGDLTDAIITLIDSTLFPKETLPTSKDRKTPWLWERDSGSDWQEAPGEVDIHSGGDFLFMASLILEEFNQD